MITEHHDIACRPFQEQMKHLPGALSAEHSKQLLCTIGLEDVISVPTGGCLVGWPVWANDDSEPGRLQVCPKMNMLG